MRRFPVHIRALGVGQEDRAGIVQFGGRLFATTMRCLGALCGGRLDASYRTLRGTCSSMTRRSPGRGRVKCIGISFLRPSRRRSCARGALVDLNRRIRRLLGSKIGRGSVTVLIHGGGDVPHVTSCFSGALRCGVMSSRTFQLSTSLTVYVVVSTLHCLSSPRGQVTETSLVVGCRLGVGNFRKGLSTLLAKTPGRLLPRTFVRGVGALELVPLCRLLRRLFDVFRVGHVDTRSTCLFTFFSTMASCLRDGSSRLSDFVHF